MMGGNRWSSTVPPQSDRWQGGRMQVARIGLTPVKGGRHRTLGSVALAEAGPVGDRVFALVDPATHRCLRTVENPSLLRASATWDGRVLSVELPDGTLVEEPVATGEVLDVDYWGRTAAVEVVHGPWAAAYVSASSCHRTAAVE